MSTTLSAHTEPSLPVTPIAPLPDQAPSSRHRDATLWILLALTILGGLVRFGTLSHPAIWGDEAATFGRTTGNYRDLLDLLQADGFAPLHYEMYWVQGKWLGFSPAVMRLIPALAGTLMIPAIYFLASQIINRRAALLTAAFACVSAYLINYAHDAKMYMHFWLMCVMHMGCLLWWLRTRLRVAWLAWVAAGLAMVGIHSAGLVMIGVEVFIALSYGWNIGVRRVSGPHPGGAGGMVRRMAGWRAPVLFVIGLVIVLAGSAGYYGGFNRWNQRINQDGWQRASGLGWIPRINAGLTGPDLFRYAGSAYLVSWEWTRSEDEANIAPWVVGSLKATIVLIAGLCLAGMFPWKKRGCDEEAPPPPQPAWRVLLWLGGWILLPMYGFYLVSMKNADGPGEWASTVGTLFNGQWWVILGEIVAVATLCVGWRGAARWLAWAAPAFVFLSFNAFWLQTGLSRPATAAQAWVDWIASAAVWPSILLAAIVIWPGVAWYYSGRTMRRRNVKTAMVLGVSAILIGLCFVMHKAMLAWAGDALADYGPIWQPRYIGLVWPALAMAVCVLLLRLPTRTLRWGAIGLLLGVNAVQAWARLGIHGTGTEPPVNVVAADVMQADTSNGALRTFINPHGGGAGPGQGSIENLVGRYYMGAMSGRLPSPLELRRNSMGVLFPQLIPTAPRLFHPLMKDPPAELREIVLWGTLLPNTPAPDGIPNMKPPTDSWRLVSERDYPTYNYWTWEKYVTFRREVYQRK